MKTKKQKIISKLNIDNELLQMQVDNDKHIEEMKKVFNMEKEYNSELAGLYWMGSQDADFFHNKTINEAYLIGLHHKEEQKILNLLKQGKYVVFNFGSSQDKNKKERVYCVDGEEISTETIHRMLVNGTLEILSSKRSDNIGVIQLKEKTK